MKIYREIRIDIETGKTLYEDAYEYSGPVARCYERDGSESDGMDGNPDGAGRSEGASSGTSSGDGGGGMSRDSEIGNMSLNAAIDAMYADSVAADRAANNLKEAPPDVLERVKKDITDVAIEAKVKEQGFFERVAYGIIEGALGLAKGLGEAAVNSIAGGLPAAQAVEKTLNYLGIDTSVVGTVQRAVAANELTQRRLSDLGYYSPQAPSGQYSSPGDGAEGQQTPTTTTPSGGTNVANPGDLTNQFYGMFTGDNPMYAPGTLLDNFLKGNQQALDTYTQGTEAIDAEWEAFKNENKDVFNRILSFTADQAGDIGGDYKNILATMADAYRAHDQQAGDIANRYRTNISNLPQLDMKLPTMFGGGSVPMAPGKWSDMYSTQAATENSLLDTATKNRLGFFQQGTNNVGARGQSMNDFINSGLRTQGMNADAAGTALANRQNNLQNMFNANQTNIQAQTYPLEMAWKLLMADKGVQGDLAKIEAQKPDKPSFLESLAPALGYAMGGGSSKSDSGGFWEWAKSFLPD